MSQPFAVLIGFDETGVGPSTSVGGARRSVAFTLRIRHSGPGGEAAAKDPTERIVFFSRSE